MLQPSRRMLIAGLAFVAVVLCLSVSTRLSQRRQPGDLDYAEGEHAPHIDLRASHKAILSEALRTTRHILLVVHRLPAGRAHTLEVYRPFFWGLVVYQARPDAGAHSIWGRVARDPAFAALFGCRRHQLLDFYSDRTYDCLAELMSGKWPGMPREWAGRWSDVRGLMYMHADAWLHPALFTHPRLPPGAMWLPGPVCRRDFEWLYVRISHQQEMFVHRVMAAVDTIRANGTYQSWIPHVFCDGNSDLTFLPRGVWRDWAYLASIFGNESSNDKITEAGGSAKPRTAVVAPGVINEIATNTIASMLAMREGFEVAALPCPIHCTTVPFPKAEVGRGIGNTYCGHKMDLRDERQLEAVKLLWL